MSDFEGKVGLVTGAASGIGESIARLYAKHGARVVVSDVNDTDGQETVDAIKDAGGEARFVHADVSNPEDCRALVDRTLERFGRLDVAFNTAGIGGEQNPTADYTVEGWQ